MQPVLKEIVAEASRSLARLDAERLEELALSCQALNRDNCVLPLQERSLLAAQAREAEREMKLLARMLDLTRANLNIVTRACDQSADRLEYGQPLVRVWNRAENGHGDN